MDQPESCYLNIPTIPSDFVQQMVAHVDIDLKLSGNTQILLAELQNKNKVSIYEYKELFKKVGEDLNDEMLGFFPKPVPLGSYAALCHFLYSSVDIYSAIENYNRFYSLFLDAGDSLLNLSELRDKQKIVLNKVSENCVQPMFQHTTIMALLKIPTWLAGQRVSLKKLQFNYEPMPFDDEFNYLFGVVPSFSADQTILQYPETVLSYLVQPKQTPHEFGDNFVEHILYWSLKGDISRQVYAEISHRLAGGDFDVVLVAKVMNMSKHTLARRLKACDTTYSEILARVRKDKALYLLLNSDEPIERIAELLGFLELGSFSRAFKSWTNLTPSQYRERT